MNDPARPDKLIALTETKGALKPCRYCGWCEGSVVSGTTMHAAGIRCCACNRHIAWLSKAALARFNERTA